MQAPGSRAGHAAGWHASARLSPAGGTRPRGLGLKGLGLEGLNCRGDPEPACPSPPGRPACACSSPRCSSLRHCGCVTPRQPAAAGVAVWHHRLHRAGVPELPDCRAARTQRCRRPAGSFLPTDLYWEGMLPECCSSKRLRRRDAPFPLSKLLSQSKALERRHAGVPDRSREALASSSFRLCRKPLWRRPRMLRRPFLPAPPAPLSGASGAGPLPAAVTGAAWHGLHTRAAQASARALWERLAGAQVACTRPQPVHGLLAAARAAAAQLATGWERAPPTCHRAGAGSVLRPVCCVAGPRDLPIGPLVLEHIHAVPQLAHRAHCRSVSCGTAVLCP